jgi:hypothetical protein
MWTVTRTALLASAALLGCAAVLSAASAATLGSAHTASTQNITDTAHMHYIREVGSNLLDEGQATGGLPGKVSALFNVGATVSATFTIHANGGSISGRGSGTLHGAGAYASFGGTMSVTHGTGRYAHAHGHGGFYGVLDRHNYSATIQTTGTLSY